MIDNAFALPYLLTSFWCRCWASSLLRRNSTAASLNAHFKWALPILLCVPPERLPADSCGHFTSRA